MEESEKGRVNGNNNNNNRDEYYGFCPCYDFVKAALNAILKCLGLESSQEICSEKEKKKKTYFFICHEDDEQINPVLPPTETETDSDPFLESLGKPGGRRRRRTPPRPPVSGGPDPQINFNPSF